MEEFSRDKDDPPVRGFLHRPAAASRGAMVLAHGAGGNSRAPLLIAVAGMFADAGITVLRIDLPYRQARPSGSPSPSTAERDRAGIRNAAAALRRVAPGPLLLAGHSYGGRQASMLAAEEPAVCDGLLLFSYPLHPPGRPERLRVAHLPKLAMPVVFIHGTRDTFGSPEEMQDAVKAIKSARILWIDKAGHDLGRDRTAVARVALDAATTLWRAPSPLG